MTNGGGFDIITNGTCFQNLTFVVTDATGRTVTTGVPTVTNEPGDATGTTPAVPLQVSAPGAGSSTTPLACRGGTTVPVIITGTPPFSGATTGPMQTYRHGVRLHWFFGDLDNLLIQIRGRDIHRSTAQKCGAIVKFLGTSMDPRARAEILRLSDLRPGLLEAMSWAKSFIGQ